MSDFNVINRTINSDIIISDLVVSGDTNSKTITFIMQNRFFDGVDLSEKYIQVNYLLSNGNTGTDICTLGDVSLESFKFEWTMQSGVASIEGNVSISAEFSDSYQQLLKTYIWQTKPKIINVESSFTVYNDALPLDYTAQENFYSLNTNNTVTVIGDTGEPIYVQKRTILMPLLEDIVVSGDARSQVVSFKFDRYYDNVDFSNKTISVKFQNALGTGGRSSIVNLIKTDTDFTFGWLLDSEVTVKDGDVQFGIEFFGYDEFNKFTCWSTKTATLPVEKGLDIDGLVVGIVPSWIQSFQMQADDLLQTNNDRFNAKYDGLEIEYATEITTVKTDILSKVKANKYTAVATVSSFPHGLTYDSTKDIIDVIYKGLLLEPNENYTVTSTTVTLVGWTIASGDIVNFKLYRNVK